MMAKVKVMMLYNFDVNEEYDNEKLVNCNMTLIRNTKIILYHYWFSRADSRGKLLQKHKKEYREMKREITILQKQRWKTITFLLELYQDISFFFRFFFNKNVHINTFFFVFVLRHSRNRNAKKCILIQLYYNIFQLCWQKIVRGSGKKTQKKRKKKSRKQSKRCKMVILVFSWRKISENLQIWKSDTKKNWKISINAQRGNFSEMIHKNSRDFLSSRKLVCTARNFIEL